MTSVYVDTMVLIDAIERDHSTSSEIVFELLEDVISSEISLAEVLVVPIREGRAELVYFYEMLFDGSSRIVAAQPVIPAILRRAAELRARHRGLKLFDAIHLGTAIETNCTHFASGGTRLIDIVSRERSVDGGPMPLDTGTHDVPSLREALRP